MADKAKCSGCKGFTNKTNDHTDMKHYKILEIYPYQGRLPSAVSLSRPNLRMLTGVLTGHCTLNKRMHCMSSANGPLCRSWGDTKEAHLPANCPVWGTEKRSYFGIADLTRKTNSQPTHILLSRSIVESEGLKDMGAQQVFWSSGKVFPAC